MVPNTTMGMNTTLEYTTKDYTIDMDSDTILGLPVATFAYILIGAGIAAGLLFLLIFSMAYKYRKKRRMRRNPLEKNSKFDNVRNIWEQDTKSRMERLKQAGYNNEAFHNMDEYQLYTVDEYSSVETGDKYKRLKGDNNNCDTENGDTSKMNGSAKKVTFNSIPVVQINGNRINDIDTEISHHSSMTAKRSVKNAEDYFVGNGKKNSHILVAAKSQQQITTHDVR